MVVTAFTGVSLHLRPQKCPSKCRRGFRTGLMTCFLLFGQPCPTTRPEILKHEMKVFFVKYNDPIYVKLEKLDIMIRLASQANIAQVGRRQGQGPGPWGGPLGRLPTLTVNISSHGVYLAWGTGSVSKHVTNVK